MSHVAPAVESFHRQLRRVKLLVLDVDGVLTDGRLFYGPRGETLKAFHVRDGHGIKALARAGIDVAIISGRKSLMVAKRARGIHDRRRVQQGLGRNAADVEAHAAERRVALDQDHFLPKVGRAERGGVAAGAGPENNHVGVEVRLDRLAGFPLCSGGR